MVVGATAGWVVTMSEAVVTSEIPLRFFPKPASIAATVSEAVVDAVEVSVMTGGSPCSASHSWMSLMRVLKWLASAVWRMLP